AAASPPPERRPRTVSGKAHTAVTARDQGTLGTSRAAVSGMTLTATDEGRLRRSCGTPLSWGPLDVLPTGVVYRDDADNGADNREDHVDRIQAHQGHRPVPVGDQSR